MMVAVGTSSNVKTSVFGGMLGMVSRLISGYIPRAAFGSRTARTSGLAHVLGEAAAGPRLACTAATARAAIAPAATTARAAVAPAAAALPVPPSLPPLLLRTAPRAGVASAACPSYCCSNS